MYMSDGVRPGNYGSTAPRIVVDPEFVNPLAFDFRLRPTSRLIGTVAHPNPDVAGGQTASPGQSLIDPGAYQSR
jgi:hypothetical protein